MFALGAISALTGIMYAVVEPDIKRMLAFSSIENIGIILLGIGASMIFLASGSPALSAIAAIAALYHLLNHSIFKGLLFMGAGSILFSTHTKNIEELGGLIKKMPVMALLFLIGVLSISALPPFSGFVSEWLLLQSLLLSFNSTDTLVRIATDFTGAGAFDRSFSFGFLGNAGMPSTAISLSTPVILSLILLFISIPSVIWYIKNINTRGKHQVYETWGCEQPVLTARNEYTACAFSKPAQMWFKNIFRPERELRASYTVSPLIKESFKFELHIEQIFERYIYLPVTDIIVGRSRTIKYIQTGSIHAYLAYIFGTMVILMLYIILGGSS